MTVTHLLRVLILTFLMDGWRRCWELIPQQFRVIFPLTLFFVQFFVMACFLYVAGLIVVGGKRARFTDAFLISLLGTVLSMIFVMFIPYPFIPLILNIFVWLLLIKRFYETGWLGAIAVGLLAMIIFLVVAIFVALIFGIIEKILELLFHFSWFLRSV